MAKDTNGRAARGDGLDLGDLPVDAINRTLGLELEPGRVRFSARAQRHARKHHPNEFDHCLSRMHAIVAAPMFVGDDLNNPGKIELISRDPAGGILVALEVEVDEAGCYNVCSTYVVNHQKIETRRQRGALQVLKTK